MKRMIEFDLTNTGITEAEWDAMLAGAIEATGVNKVRADAETQRSDAQQRVAKLTDRLAQITARIGRIEASIADRERVPDEDRDAQFEATLTRAKADKVRLEGEQLRSEGELAQAESVVASTTRMLDESPDQTFARFVLLDLYQRHLASIKLDTAPRQLDAMRKAFARKADKATTRVAAK